MYAAREEMVQKSQNVLEIRPAGLEPATLGLEIDGKDRTLSEHLQNTGDF
jgi:Tfp pilus assembly PilM family ATPase